MFVNVRWKDWHMALSAANTVDVAAKPPRMLISDVDLDSVKISVPD